MQSLRNPQCAVYAEAFGCMEGALIAALQIHAFVEAKASLYVCKWVVACQGAGSRFAFDFVVWAEAFLCPRGGPISQSAHYRPDG